jgi:hypothetical protein
VGIDFFFHVCVIGMLSTSKQLGSNVMWGRFDVMRSGMIFFFLSLVLPPQGIVSPGAPPRPPAQMFWQMPIASLRGLLYMHLVQLMLDVLTVYYMLILCLRDLALDNDCQLIATRASGVFFASGYFDWLRTLDNSK